MSGKALLKLLEKAGWTIDRISGVDLKPGILNSILKKAGLK